MLRRRGVAWSSGRSVEVVRRGLSICAPRRSRACFGVRLRLRAGADQTVAIGPLGNAYVVWAAQSRTAGVVHTGLRMTVVRRDGRALGHEHAPTRAADGDASRPSLAVRRDGTAAVAWRASLPAGEQDSAAPIMAATSTATAVAAPPQVVSQQLDELPQLRLGAQGEAILAWTSCTRRRPTRTPRDRGRRQARGRRRVRSAGDDDAPRTSRPAARRSPSTRAGVAYLVYSAAAGTGATPGGAAGITHVRPPGSVFGPPVAARRVQRRVRPHGGRD
jgi:hypothetical protein